MSHLIITMFQICLKYVSHSWQKFSQIDCNLQW